MPSITQSPRTDDGLSNSLKSYYQLSARNLAVVAKNPEDGYFYFGNIHAIALDRFSFFL